MKCQHCGVNFEDGERECPICGARAGSRGRLTAKAKPRETAQPAAKPKEKTVLNGRPAKKERKSGAWFSIVIAVLVLGARLVPAAVTGIADAAARGMDRIGALVESAPEPAPEPAADVPAERPEDSIYFADENGLLYAMLYDLWGENGALVELPSGEALVLYADGSEAYELRVGDRFYESGQGWAVYNDPAEYPILTEEFPSDSYISFTLCLTYDTLEWNGAAEDIAYHEQEGEMWLAVIATRDGSERYLVDIFGDAAFLFGGARYLPLEPL